ncbi:hypothetical protein [Dactylosporangium sp. CA-233914]|uniref:hypothetical protein n=1 Tax=Dactylosporangium sp. CA-233914 TaxID=3239934 RepID=UPI003D936960
MAGSVKANPGLYFGAYPAADWPLIIAAWTAADLLRLAPAAPHVAVTLHRDGSLSATVCGATVTAPSSGDQRPLPDIIRAGMWYTELSRATTVTITPECPPVVLGPERMWSGLTVTIGSTLDASLFGLPEGTWWRDGVPRLAKLLAAPRHRLPGGRRVHITDGSTGETAALP